MTTGGRDIEISQQPQDGNGQLPEGRHEVWNMPTAYLGTICIERDISHLMQLVLDTPMLTPEVQQV